ncbi:hypothetical protein Btru_009320 [Bulinus truncatus]|nr:hypothetical protein Btru_009320 [Bulinus truncatus]
MSMSSTKIWQPRPTINESFTALVEQYPDKEIFVFYNNGKRDPYTVATLYTLAGRFADRLRRYGFQKQDIIANTLPNCPERVVTDLGIILAGCVTLNISHLLSDGRDLYHAARKSKCKCIIMSDSAQSPTWSLLQSKLCGKDTSDFFSDISVEMAPDIKSAILVSRNNIGTRSRKPLLEDLRTCNEDVFVNTCCLDDNVVVFSTSGSTGYSKMVPKTHREIVDNINRNGRSSFGKNAFLDVDLAMYSDVIIGWGPGFSAYSILAPVTRVLRDAYDLDHTSANKDFWEAAAKEKCAMALLIPLEVEKHLAYAQRDIGHVPHRFKYIKVIGQPITKKLAKKFFHLADTVLFGFGNTECFGISEINVDEKSYQSYNCGKHFDMFDVRVVDEENKPCPPNIYNFACRKRGGFVGYLNKLEDTDQDTLKSLTQDGWLNTQDYGYIDDAGNLFVLGRNKDVISYGCVLVYPCWLEEMITEHPDVIQACLVPVSDPVLHQNICACIKMSAGSTSGTEDLRRYCENMFLPNVADVLTPRPGFYMSCYVGQGPVIRCPGPHLRCPGPNRRCPAPHIRFPAPHIRCPAPHIRFPGPHIRCPGPHIRCPAPHIRFPGPHIRCPLPYIRCPAPPLDSLVHTLDALDQTEDALHHTLDSLVHTLDALDQTEDALHHTLDALVHTLDDLDHTLDALHHTLDALVHTLDDLDHTLDALETTI